MKLTSSNCNVTYLYLVLCKFMSIIFSYFLNYLFNPIMFMPTFIIKLTELAIAVACLVLQQYSYDLTDVPTLVLCSGTYVGFILVISGEIIGEMVFAPLDFVQDLYYGLLGMTMFASCGWILYSSRSDAERSPRTDDTFALYSAGLAMLNVVVMMCEMITKKQDPFVEAWWSGASAVLFGACAARTLYDWRYVPDSSRREIARASAMCAIVTTSVLILDAVRVLCTDDGTSSISSPKKKKKTPSKKALDFTAAPVRTPMGGKFTGARIIPAKVPLRDVNPPKPGINANDPKTFTGGIPKMSPHKIPLSKFPTVCKPLRMPPKLNQSLW